jgi:hypothetical protein
MKKTTKKHKNFENAISLEYMLQILPQTIGKHKS